MQQNSKHTLKRPVLVDEKDNNQTWQKKSQEMTSSQRLAARVASEQGIPTGKRQTMTLKERAEQHKREMYEQEQAEEQALSEEEEKEERQTKLKPPHFTLKKTKLQKRQKKGPSYFDMLFVRTDEAKGIGAPDFFIIEVVAVLLAIGLVMVFSASSYRSLVESGSAYSYFIKQCVVAVAGIVGAFIVTTLNPTLIRKLAPMLLFIVLILLIYTAFRGEEALGATRWVTIAGIRLQPSEFAKPLMAICTAGILRNGVNFYKDEQGILNRENIIIFAMICATFAVIAKEDLGSALAIFGGCFAVFIVAGLSKRGIVGVLALGVTVSAIYIMREPYRIQRLTGFLNQTDADAASGNAYQLVQSLYAFGSGGLFGVGLGNSSQKLLYLPEMHTDFIYAVIGEEFGLIGALLVLGLFMALAWRGFWLVTHIEDKFRSYLAFAATMIIVVQALINMAVAVGVFPVTGITLPLISYGGSSLLATLLTLGILLNASRYVDKTARRREKRKEQKTE